MYGWLHLPTMLVDRALLVSDSLLPYNKILGTHHFVTKEATSSIRSSVLVCSVQTPSLPEYNNVRLFLNDTHHMHNKYSMLMFPIRTQLGRHVAYIGRKLHPPLSCQYRNGIALRY